MKLTSLDRWDIALIRHFKSAEPPYDIPALLKLWGERCDLSPEYVHLSYIVERAADLVESFNPLPLRELMERTSPTKGWRFNLRDEATHWERWLAVFGSHLCLTEVKLLPGYAEAMRVGKPGFAQLAP